MLKKVFRVADMHCAMCAMNLESIEDELPGIKRIQASYHRQQMEVEYDESQVNESQIVAAARQKGYAVAVI